jgi:hypothetical protein
MKQKNKKKETKTIPPYNFLPFLSRCLPPANITKGRNKRRRVQENAEERRQNKESRIQQTTSNKGFGLLGLTVGYGMGMVWYGIGIVRYGISGGPKHRQKKKK